MNRTATKSVNGNTYTYCNTGGITVPAGGSASPLAGPAYPYPSNMLIPDLPGTVNTVTVSLNSYSNQRPEWENTLLVGPSGATAASLDFFSTTGGPSPVSGLNLGLADANGTLVSSTSLSSGNFKPTSRSAANTYPSPAPSGPYNYAASAAYFVRSDTFITFPEALQAASETVPSTVTCFP